MPRKITAKDSPSSDPDRVPGLHSTVNIRLVSWGPRDLEGCFYGVVVGEVLEKGPTALDPGMGGKRQEEILGRFLAPKGGARKPRPSS